MSHGWWRGTVLKKIRQRRKLTQAELAQRVGVHVITITRLETGARQPSMDLLHRLAKVHRVKAGDLLT